MVVSTGDLVFSLRQVGKIRPGQEGFRLQLARFDVARGSLLALAGPSGCGKSTALDLLACVLRPDILVPDASGERDTRPRAGRQETLAADADALPPFTPHEARFIFAPTPEHGADVLTAWRKGGTDALARLRLHYLGYVLQTGGLLPFLSAGENILLRCKSLGIAEKRRDAVQAVTRRLGIAHLLKQYPGTLSVGERQRVAIAAALAHGPGVVLADEPTAALDPCHARNVLALFGELTREMGITMIMVTHNPELAQETGFTLARVAVQSRPDGIAACIEHPFEPALTRE